ITRAVRGDLEVILRAAFRATPQTKWKNLVQGLSFAGGFAGDVSEVTASRPEDTDKPFEYSYHYHRTDYPDWSEKRILAPSPPFGLPDLTDDPTEATKPEKCLLPAGMTTKLFRKSSAMTKICTPTS